MTGAVHARDMEQTLHLWRRDSDAWLEHRRRSSPMDADLSWFSVYGFCLLAGLGARDVETLAANGNGYKLVEDRHTRRSFVMDRHGSLVQFHAEQDAHRFPS